MGRVVGDGAGPRIGVLALQGASALHLDALASLEADALAVRTPADLDAVDALILPGGESTTISMLLEANDLVEPLVGRLHDGMPVLGTCAGMILLARRVLDGRSDQVSFDAVDIDVRRNAYGRQVDSFEADVEIEGLDDPFHAVFIRAPRVDRVGDGVEVMAALDDRPVLCRQGAVWASSFHPELIEDRRLHQLFIDSLTREHIA